MNTRNWSIRSKITALVTVPLVALLALWIFATALSVGPALNLLSARTLLDDVGRPGEALVAELQKERRLSLIHLARRDDDSALATQRAATDRAIGAFRGAATGSRARDVAGELLRSRISQVLTAVEGLPSNRGYIDRREVDKAGAQNLYSSIIDSIFLVFSATATYEDPEIDRETRALTTIGRAREWLSRADSLLAGANAAGTFTGDEHGRLIQALGAQQFLYAEAVAELPQQERIAYQRLTGSDSFVRLQALQNELVQSSGAGAAPPVRGNAWQPAYDTVVQQLRAFELNATESLADRAAPVAVGILVRLALAGLLGLLAVVVSLVVSVRVARSLIGRLAQLRAALDAAGEQLPSLVRRLRRGETVDVEVESPSIDYGSDEIGRLGQAFGQVRRVAVQSAVDEAVVRRGLNEVFLNIARRSQTLLHRQLSLLDRMERRETEPQELEDLYRVDHLATRMRRHAEDLVILAGAAPGRGWRNPVPVVDVVRGAISEVEDYKRIDISGVETASLVGRAVGDVIHLLAELLENATSFSPPNTRVQVAGQVVPNGYAVEIEDRGLGMAPEALADVNRRLLEPPEFDPSDSARLGLYVVAKLAGRHRIRVQLRPSPYGGVTAVTLIPADLITTAPGPVALPAGPTPADRSWDRRPGEVTAAPRPERRAVAGTPRQSPAATASPARAVPVTSPAAVPPAVPTPPAPVTPAAPVAPAVPAAPVTPAAPVVPVTPAVPAVPLVPAASAASGMRAGSGAAATAAAPPVAEPVGAGGAGGAYGAGGACGAGAPSGARPMSPPVPASTVDGVTSDGLARRRRVVPRPRAAPADADAPTLATMPLVTPASAPGGPDRPPAAAPAPAHPAGEDGLPRRVRQASLTPQLRRPVEPDAEPSARSPEDVRRLMSALQSGTTRGRLAAASAPAPARNDGAGEPSAMPEGRAARHRSAGVAPDRTWAHVATAGYPVTRNAAGASAEAATVVHHGEIVPRPAADAAPPRSRNLPDAPRDGDVKPPEKDT